MPRVYLDFPDEIVSYTTELRVRLSDVNRANHVGNDAFVRMFSDLRAEFWQASGITQIQPDASSGILVTDLVVLYKAEAHIFDLLRFEFGVHDVNKYGADVLCRVTRPADGALVAVIKSGFVYGDYGTGRVCPPPADFTAKFGGPALA